MDNLSLKRRKLSKISVRTITLVHSLSLLSKSFQMVINSVTNDFLRNPEIEPEDRDRLPYPREPTRDSPKYPENLDWSQLQKNCE